ncbi:MAG TPA: AfsA-related hotdog domain-containing protein [Microlunatus sp.]
MSLNCTDRSTADWREVTHKLYDENVMVTWVDAPESDGPLALGDRCTVELSPRIQGCLLTSSSAQSPTLLTLEALRQAGLALAHVCGSAAVGVTMLANAIRLQWRRPPEHPPTRVWCSIVVTDVVYRRGRLHRLRFDAEISDETTPLAYGHGDMTCIPHAVYARMRRDASMSEPDGPSSPPLSDVVVAESRLTARTDWDTSDRLIFDHPLDHVPGMHFALAALRAHATLRGTDWTDDRGVELEFSSLAELDSDLTVRARRDGGRTVVDFQQGGNTIATARCPDELIA